MPPVVDAAPATPEAAIDVLSGRMATATKQATLGVLSSAKKLADHPAISHLKTSNPTAAQILLEADTNQDGNYSTDEVASLVAKLLAVNKAATFYKRFSAGVVILLLIVVGAVFAVSTAAAELAKETHIKNGAMVSADGDQAVVGTSLALFDNGDFLNAPSMSIRALRRLESVTYLFDATADAEYGGKLVEATTKLCGAIKTTPNVTTLISCHGDKLTVDGHARTATVRMVADGKTFNATSHAALSTRYRLMTGANNFLYSERREDMARGRKLDSHPFSKEGIVQDTEGNDGKDCISGCYDSNPCPPYENCMALADFYLYLEGSVMHMSDARLKTNITYVGNSSAGVRIYTFRYRPGTRAAGEYGTQTLYRGTLAQELLGTPFESAVVYQADGMMAVNYSQLDVPFVVV